jgi:hypothetical protein
MTAIGFDPFRAERAARWRNRLARWRVDLSQTLLHLLALVVLAVLLLSWVLPQVASLAEPARSILQRWPLPIAALLLALFASRQAQRRARLQQREQREWWAAQAVAASARTARRRELQWLEALGQWLLGSALLWGVGASWPAHLVLLGLVALGALISLPLARRSVARERRREALRARWQDPGRGRLWRWQRIETGVALRGRPLALGLWALLLVPIDSGPGVVLGIGVAGALVAILGTAWQRTLDVLPQAHAWLRAQPAAGGDWLRASLALPLLVLAVALLLLTALLVALGTPMLGVALAATLAALAGLQFACTFAWRAEPRRIALHVTLQVVLLLAMVQAVAPLALPLWLLQVLWLLRRGVRA